MKNTNEETAKLLYGTFTPTGVIGRFYGPAKAAHRAKILTILSKTEISIPKSKATWGRFRDAVIQLFGAEGDCVAAVDSDLAKRSVEFMEKHYANS